MQRYSVVNERTNEHANTQLVLFCSPQVGSVLPHDRWLGFDFNRSFGGVDFFRVSSYVVAESLVNYHQRARRNVDRFVSGGGGQYIFSSFEQCQES
jgi:hypothetical protein